MIIKNNFKEFFALVNPNNIKISSAYIKKTTSVGWSISFPFKKPEIIPPFNKKEVIRNLLC